MRRRIAAVVLAAACFVSGGSILPPSHAAFPGRNGRIFFFACDVFCSAEGSDSDIFSIRPDGSGLRRLSHNRAYDRLPSVSADGRKVVFSCKGSIRRLGQICVMDADGSDRVKLTSDPDRNLGPASWSPDGKRIAFIREDNSDHLMVMDADGTNVHEVLDRPLGINFPEWSPETDEILFTGLRAEGVLEFDVFTFDLGASQETNLTESDEDESMASWAPYGDRILYAQGHDTGYNAIYSMASDGGSRHLVTDEPANFPAGSPNGKLLVFVHGRKTDLMRMRRDGTGLVRLTRRLHVFGPDWQPR